MPQWVALPLSRKPWKKVFHRWPPSAWCDMPIGTNGKSSAQRPIATLSLFFRVFFNVLFTASTWPLVWGW